MGCYVNPIDGRSKEKFLRDECEEGRIERIFNNPKFEDYTNNYCLPVILVDNGPFTAAGVAYDKREFEGLTNKNDPRPKKLFKVKISKLIIHSDLKIYL